LLSAIVRYFSFRLIYTYCEVHHCRKQQLWAGRQWGDSSCELGDTKETAVRSGTRYWTDHCIGKSN